MKFSEMIEGLQILAKYEDEGLEARLNGADHDVIWASTAEVNEDAPEVDVENGEPVRRDARITDEDAARLEELGWFVADEYSDAWTHYC